MSTIEITTPVLISAGLALASLLTATWALSRRSRGWDESTLITQGDPATGKKSLNARVVDIEDREIPTLKDTVLALGERVKWLSRALNAHGSDEHSVVRGARDTLDSVAREQARLEIEHGKKQAEKIRARLILEQGGRFPLPRRDDEFVESIIDAIAPPDSDETPPERPSYSRDPRVEPPYERESRPSHPRERDTPNKFGPGRKR